MSEDKKKTVWVVGDEDFEPSVNKLKSAGYDARLMTPIGLTDTLTANRPDAVIVEAGADSREIMKAARFAEAAGVKVAIVKDDPNSKFGAAGIPVWEPEGAQPKNIVENVQSLLSKSGPQVG